MDRFSTIIANLYTQYNFPMIFPVPLVSIANALGYTVFDFQINQNNRHISGAVLYEQKKILLNPTELPSRRNFTLAHEIGHIVLDGPAQKGSVIDTRNDILQPPLNTRECDANEFAAELLMPATEFRSQWEKTRSVVSLSDYFNTSISATIVRLERLGL